MKTANETIYTQTRMTQQNYNLILGRLVAIENFTKEDEREYRRLMEIKIITK